MPAIVTGVTAYSQNAATVDAISGRIFFKSNNQLVIVSVRQSAVNVLTVGQCCTLLQYDQATGALYGIDASGPNVIIRSINLATGATQGVVTTSATSVSLTQPAFDPISRRLFFIDGIQAALYVVDLQNASSTHVALNNCCSALAYEPAVGTLFGLDSSGPQTVLVSVNPVTGNKSAVLSTGAQGVTLVPIGLDLATHRLFFETGIQQALFTVNLSPPSASSVSVSPCCGPLFFVLDAGAIPLLTTPALVALVLVVCCLGIYRSTAS